MNKLTQSQLSFLLPVCLLALFAAGCSLMPRGENGNVRSDGNNYSGAASDDSATKVPLSEKQSFTKKFNAFIECSNRVDERVILDYQEYIRDTKDQPALTGGGGKSKNSSSWSAPTLGFVSDFEVEKVNALKKAIDAAPPLDPLDRIGREYAAAFDKLYALTKEAIDYYKQKDYKDDNFKKGKELHEPLLAAYKNFENASKQMSGEIDLLEDANLHEDFAELEKQGVSDTRYQVLNLRIAAKKLYRASQQSDVSFETFDPLLQNFSQALDEAKKFAAANKNADENKSFGDEKLKGLVYSDGSVIGEKFQIEAKEFGRHLRDEHKTPESGSGSPKSMSDEYNNLINAFNGSPVSFSPAM